MSDKDCFERDKGRLKAAWAAKDDPRPEPNERSPLEHRRLEYNPPGMGGGPVGTRSGDGGRMTMREQLQKEQEDFEKSRRLSPEYNRAARPEGKRPRPGR